ncbi:hypothetical protein ANO11243_046660 [Dothideomycetidae sp. 11243]|nr:hypothetical protein ANO11243_046660 [fungal sp. No.11243]
MGIKRRRDEHDEIVQNGKADSNGNAHTRKKQHSYSEADAELAGLYSSLADDVKATRLQAARDILVLVDRADDDRLEKVCQRLVRGLCSSRKAARLGYGVVLTEVFAKQCPVDSPTLSFGEWLRHRIGAIETVTTPPGKGSNQSSMVSNNTPSPTNGLLIFPDGFFSAKASVERKAIGLQIMQMAIASAPTHVIHQLFPPNILRCIINQRSNTNNNLSMAAQGPLSALIARVKVDHHAAVPILQALIGTAGLTNFDRLTKTKTLEEILSFAACVDAAAILGIISRNIRHPKTSENLDADTSRRSSADILLTYARKQGAVRVKEGADAEDSTEFPWTALLECLSYPAYFVEEQQGDGTNSKKTREVFQARIMSVLTFTMETKLDTTFDHAYELIVSMDGAAQSGEQKLTLIADSIIQQVLSRSISRVRMVKEQESEARKDTKPMLQAFKLLFSLSILQVYTGDADAVSLLEELDDCFQMWSKSKNPSSALLEILLGFVSRPSALFRKLAEQVFSAICDQVDEEGIASLLDILDKTENLNGQKELFDNADDVESDDADLLEESSEDGGEDTSDDDDDDDDDSEDGEDASDVEIIDVDEDADSGDLVDSDVSEGTASSDSESSENASETEDVDDEVTAFETKLAQTLGTSKAVINGDDAADTSDESDMDDEQMMALDGHLTTIFKERSKQSNKKKESKDAKGTVVNFKNRVLDLLAIYVKQCYQSGLAIDLILPLLRLTRTTQTKAVSERSFGVLKQLFDTCTKHKEWPDKSSDELLVELDGVHVELKQSTSKIHATAASRSGLFLAKLLVSKDKAFFADVADKYAGLQKEWFASNQSKIPASTFTEWTSWTLNSRKA